MTSNFPIIQYLPLTRPRATRRFFNKLNKRGVHAIFDLEDSAQDPFDIEKTKFLKEEARNGLIKISDTFNNALESKIYIRVNSRSSEYFKSDIECIVESITRGMPIDGLFLPKVESYTTLEEIYNILNKHQIELDLVPMIETSIGYDNLESILHSDLHSNVISRVHYGHFDYCLDSDLWPFPDPFHEEYWEIIMPIISLLSNYNKTYIHTPFPFPKNTELFWLSQFYLKSLVPNLDFWACTLNLELSLSDCPSEINELELRKIKRYNTLLAQEAEQIVHDFYQGRASKRSFGVSSERFIPPHQVFAAKKYLSREKG